MSEDELLTVADWFLMIQLEDAPIPQVPHVRGLIESEKLSRWCLPVIACSHSSLQATLRQNEPIV